MKTETLHAQLFTSAVAFQQLLTSGAKLRLLWISNQHISRPAGPWVVPEADELRQAIRMQEVDVGDIVQIHQGTQLFGLLVFLDRGVLLLVNMISSPFSPIRSDKTSSV
eukprot:CAMPEP_0114696868 /NCGR_PEP_ID=MMETSP0191-20121206/73080_2 /TAXON_ID=126664 /ORGANISM="Sorites sp." /LENGTH=108 /DNA_ID=CAMNT_0001995125 /DNA_START=769 /DNA_END=1095 /DNA_ORIENTATION=-